MDNISTEFQGFKPSEYTRTYVDDVLHVIQEEAPYGSAVSANFVRENERVKGTIKINSVVGRFFAVAEGSRLSEVSMRLKEQMRHQLNKWKAMRFQTAAG